MSAQTLDSIDTTLQGVTPITLLCSATEATCSILKVSAPDAVALVDPTGRVFVYSEQGEKLDTGVVMPLPLREGMDAVYDVLRALGLRCARP